MPYLIVLTDADGLLILYANIEIGKVYSVPIYVHGC